MSFINTENGADPLPWGELANKHFKAFRVKHSSEAVSRLWEDIPLLCGPYLASLLPPWPHCVRVASLLHQTNTTEVGSVGSVSQGPHSHHLKRSLCPYPKDAESFPKGQLTPLPSLPQRLLCISSQGGRLSLPLESQERCPIGHSLASCQFS